MRLISHKFSDLINLDVKEGRRRSVKRGNYRDFAGMIPVESAGSARQGEKRRNDPFVKFKRTFFQRLSGIFYRVTI
ncbi:hypothetical protein ENT52713_21400 [Enterobacter sp. 200527-13]|nr:hypothetical protein ENT52713_21400 [Enterobacter sp. 200527-13]